MATAPAGLTAATATQLLIRVGANAVPDMAEHPAMPGSAISPPSRMAEIRRMFDVNRFGWPR